jgi:hypothetical protein
MKARGYADVTQSAQSDYESGAAKDDSLTSSVFYQALREKERLIREYKFKYETTKALYEELLNVLIAQAEKPGLEPVGRQHITHICQIVDEELSKIQVKRPEINKIKFILMERIERIITPIMPQSTSSGNWSSPKAIRPDSQHETHTGKISSSNNSVHSEPFASKTYNEKPRGNYVVPQILLQSPIEIAKKLVHSTTYKEYMLNQDRSVQTSGQRMDIDHLKTFKQSQPIGESQPSKGISRSVFEVSDPYGLTKK